LGEISLIYKGTIVLFRPAPYPLIIWAIKIGIIPLINDNNNPIIEMMSQIIKAYFLPYLRDNVLAVAAPNAAPI